MTPRQIEKKRIEAVNRASVAAVQAGLVRLGLMPANGWLESHHNELSEDVWCPMDVGTLARLIALAEGK